MCGIAGIINYQQHNLEKVKHALFHRGPDEQSIYTENNLALIHTRLAIQDVQHGKQPFHYSDYSIVFNGEIYNHIELRQLLPEIHFQTRSDTETLLHLYIKYGADMFSKLDGMFAFCIYDRKNNFLFLARDRVGKKPLYYIDDDHSFIFASELNAIKSIKKVSIDENAINCYLRTGFIYKSYTPYQKLYELAPATYCTVDLNTREMKQKKYYEIYDNYLQRTASLNLREAVRYIDENLQRSIRDRLLASDVEIGIFLSGGIDSNLIAAVAAQSHPNIKTFTVKFDSLYDESALAKLTANKYATTHTELNLTIDLDKDVERILSNYGEPFMDSSAIPSYYIAKEAKKSVSVVLNGDGADELFGGYRRYVPLASRMLRAMQHLEPLKHILPKPKTKQSVYNYLYRLICMGNKKDLDFYLSATSDIYEDVFAFPANGIINELRQFINGVFNKSNLTPLRKMLYLDFNLLLLSDLLVKMDIATMANSLEARSPFLSKYMLDLAPQLADKYKVNKWTTKYALRELSKKYLPTKLINQPKRGFEVPLKKWVAIDLKHKIYDSLQSGCYSESYINRGFINQLLQNKIDLPEEKRAKMLWNLFCLEIWYKHDKATNGKLL